MCNQCEQNTIMNKATNYNGDFNQQLDIPPVTVTGTVVDQDGDTVMGASIHEVGNTLNGTTTDINGNFTLDDVPQNGEVEVRYLGLTTTKLPAHSVPATINMQADLNGLPPIVIEAKNYWRYAGYGAGILVLIFILKAVFSSSSAPAAAKTKAPGMAAPFKITL